MSERQYAGLRTAITHRARGVKTFDRGKDRRQIALRPKKHLFDAVSAWADEWEISWNEAALRILEAGLSKQ